jgi:hypothetical protein
MDASVSCPYFAERRVAAVFPSPHASAATAAVHEAWQLPMLGRRRLERDSSHRRIGPKRLTISIAWGMACCRAASSPDTLRRQGHSHALGKDRTGHDWVLVHASGVEAQVGPQALDGNTALGRRYQAVWRQIFHVRAHKRSPSSV